MSRSVKKLEAFASTRALDVVALPLVAEHGFAEAYRMAMAQIETSAPASNVFQFETERADLR